ncbi:hypothetical protein [Ferrimicrobium sp.]|uniref:NrtR DNA-binding winged helix domain-containing protein n=1 Tax=Ferrimicrobium sp. TaxID=2926050 RepID=UPI0026139189|nr:hypothetical protein [Ferrimicrobium sp.]
MCQCSQRLSISLTVVPLLLTNEQPHVLLSPSAEMLSLLRVGIDHLDVDLTHYAERFLVRTLGLSISRLTQCGADQDLSRQPPAIDICYYGFANSQFINGDDLIWLPLYQLLPEQDHRRPQTATPDSRDTAHQGQEGRPHALSPYDRRLLSSALTSIRQSLDRRPVIEEIEPAAFTLSYLQHRTETLLGVTLHTQNFRRKLLDSGSLESIDIAVQQATGRPALLYRVRNRSG